jgi:restriction system protein
VEIAGVSAGGGTDGFVTPETNPFVSFKVLFQCKRYAEVKLVSRAQVGDFRNTMRGRAEKGIMITTSAFTNARIRKYLHIDPERVGWIDGLRLPGNVIARH